MANKKIKVYAILTEPNVVTEASVKQMLSDVNLIYDQIGLTFELAGFEKDFNHDLKNDSDKGPKPIEIEMKRTAKAVRYPGYLVVFFRNGNGGYGSTWGEHLVMPNAEAKLFIHEVGHFLHLGHTHNDDSTDEIYKAIKNFGYAKAKDVVIEKIKKTGGLDSFDGDYPAVKDTPPDPGPPLYQVSGYDANGGAVNSQEHCSGVVKLNVNGIDYEFKPDRTNIMSYFFRCPKQKLTISPDQARIVKSALTSRNRRHLTDGVSPEAPAAVTAGDGAIHVFARGDNLEIYHSVRSKKEWSGWNNDIGNGTLISGVTAVTHPDGFIHVFGVGTDCNMWHNFGKGKTWNGWTNDSGQGTLTSAPTAVVSSDGAIHVFARGSDSNIWHNYWADKKWSGWQNDLGAGTLTSGPTAVAMQNGEIHVFARGTDRNVWHSYWDKKVWSGWLNNAGTGTLTSAPTALISPDKAIHLFARGDDRRLWHTFWDGKTWRGWLADLGDETFLSGPAAVVSADKVINLFALGDDRKISHSAWENQKWSKWNATLGDGAFQP